MKFSIVTPSFRQLEWLRLCAASVADQQGVEIEHIVRDAGTGPELEAWAAQQPKVALVVEKDGGMYDAINRGLVAAQGEICAYLNCDEQYLPGTLAKVARYFADHPEVEMLFGDAVLIDAEGNPLSYRRMVKPSALHTRMVHLNTLSCATFFRRSLVEKGFLFDISYRAIGDAVWIHRLLTAGVRMAVLPEPLAVFTFTGANLGASSRSTEEGERWRRAPGAPPGWLTQPASVCHRFRKLFAGAYFPRKCAIEIYTKTAPHQRTAHSVDRVGFSWPHDLAATSTDPAKAPVGGERENGPVKVAAVFTTFNRSAVALTCLERLNQQTAPPFRTFIVDNGSSDGTTRAILQAYGADDRIQLVTLPTNIGNPGGIRVAIEKALEAGADAVWILDDDSWPKKETLAHLLPFLRRDQVHSTIVVDPKSAELAWPCMVSRPHPHVVQKLADLPADPVFEITGAWLGALIPKEIVNAAGLPEAALFIRGEDEEYPLRIRRKGYRFFCVKDALLEHPSPHQLVRIHGFGKNYFYEPNLPLWKGYYVVRNRAYLHRQFAGSWLKGVAQAVASVGLAVGVALLRDGQKLARVRTYLQAGWHGFNRQLGKAPPASAAKAAPSQF